jgi:Flp pilus assembly protein TadG
MLPLWSKLRRALRTFGAERSGNVAITFAIAALPVIGGVGAAVDYSHANSVKVALQAALDSTALMLSKEAANDSSAQLQTNAVKYFKAMFTKPEATNIAITTSYTTSGGSAVVVNGQADVPTAFMGIMGYKNITVAGSSTAKWGSQRLRVALVLDNTGSMADDGKISALKSATQSLLTQLQAAAGTNGDVYVSIIPFVKDVNLGAGNYNSNYIYWGTTLQDPTLSDSTSWDANNGSCSKSNGSGWGWWGTGAATRSNCVSIGGTWTPDNHNTWNGCVMDRGYKSTPDTVNNYDTNVAAPSTTVSSSLYAAEQYSSCPQAVMGLSYDWAGMSSLVNNMAPAGNTNQAIGLQLGWMSLAGGGPFTAPAKDPNYTYQEIIILLTDGLNTQDRWYTSQSSIDTRQELTCNNVKAAKITLYTIQVNTGGDPTSTLLQNCASDSSKFWMLTSASGIATAFNQIGTNLTQLRVAR